MSFSLHYRTTEQISPGLQREMCEAADEVGSEFSWVFCHGPSLENDDGYLAGDSQLNMSPDEDDAADARSDAKPDGSFRELLQCLCRVSGQFDVDFEVSHDHGGPYFIRCGRADDELDSFGETFGDISDEFPDGV